MNERNIENVFGFCQGSSTDLLSHQTSLIPTHLLMEQQVLGPHHPLLFIKDSDFSRVSRIMLF